MRGLKGKRVRVRVEGCLDAVLAKLLLERLGVEPEVPMPQGGKAGVIRDVAADIKRRLRVIGFIDADEDADQSLNQAARMISKKVGEGYELRVLRGSPPHLLIAQGGRLRAVVIVWGEPPDYTRGTIEDLVCSILGRRVCTETTGCLLEGARLLQGCEPSEKSASKLAPVALLGVCGGASTLVYDQVHRRCGFDPAPILERLAAGHEHLEPYERLLSLLAPRL